MHTKPVLDDEGIPILTEPLAEREIMASDDRQLAERLSGLSTTAIVRSLLSSEPFREQLDALTARLTRDVHEELLKEMQPALEAVLGRIIEENASRSLEIIHQHLEASLPGLLARTLRKD